MFYWRANYKFSIILIVALLIVGCRQSYEPDLESRVNALFAAYDVGERPGYAIGIVQNGELIYANGFGLTDLTSQQHISPKTAFNIASLSKQFTAAATALDIQAGRQSLDDKLSDHWDNLPNFMDDITIAHLVYMTSGLPEYYTLSSPKGGWASEDQFTVDDAISAVFAAGTLEYNPGTRWTYSNINYQFLAETSSRINKTEFSELMHKQVFAPLGMSNSWVDSPIDQNRDNRAASHVWESGQWRDAPRLSPHYGGSGIYASVEDLAKWDKALYFDKFFGSDFTNLMLSTRTFDHDKTNDAFGLVHGEYRGQPTIWYEGGDYGASAYMVRLPKRDETIICLSNFANAGCVAKASAVIDVLIAFSQ